MATAKRRVIDSVSGTVVDASIYLRLDLVPGAWLDGPAIVLEEGTSIIVPSGFTALLTVDGDLLIEETVP